MSEWKISEEQLHLVNTAHGGHNFAAPEFFAAASGVSGPVANGKVGRTAEVTSLVVVNAEQARREWELLPKPDPEREEVEERLEDARDDDQPRAAVHHEIPLEEQVAPAARERRRRHLSSLCA